MNALTRTLTGQALAEWVNAAEQNLNALPSGKGLDILKLTKQGEWVFGSKLTKLAQDDFVAVNPFSVEVGYIAFSDAGELLGEQTASLAAPPIRIDQLPPVNSARGWQKQVSFACQILDGQNAGTAVVYKTSSVGGMDFGKRIIAEMMAKLRTGSVKCVPVLDLHVDSYQHSNKSYGTIFTPEYEIVDWVDMNFDPVVDDEPDAVEAPAAEAAPAPRPRGRPAGSSKKAEAEAAAPAVDDVAGRPTPEPGRRMRRT
jgi:hypothetical protein